MPDDSRIRQSLLEIVESEKIIGGRFTNIKRIDPNGGNGYFSLMFCAHDNKTGEKVALKFFDPTKYNEAERLERFHREAQMLEKLRPETYVITCVSGLDRLERELVDAKTSILLPLSFEYFALELADASMEHYIYSDKIDALTSLLYFKEMIKAVRCIHAKSICHRDLKPSNFLLVSREVRLSDFGTAKWMDGTGGIILQSYKYPVGDFSYCPPEVLCSLGIDDEYVFSADMFAMGAILFEMFTQNVLSTEI